MTKYFFENFSFQLNKVFVSNIASWKLQKPVFDYRVYRRKNKNPVFIRSNFLNTLFIMISLQYTCVRIDSKVQSGTSLVYLFRKANLNS